MMMSAGGHPGHLQLTFETIPTSPHYSRGFAAAFQFISGSYKLRQILFKLICVLNSDFFSGNQLKWRIKDFENVVCL